MNLNTRLPPPMAPPAIVSRPVTHKQYHSQLRCLFGVLSGESFLSVTEERGPSAGTIRPSSMMLFQRQAAYPAYAGLFIPFQIKVLPTVFHFIPPIHPQVLTSDPRVGCHIPGLHEVLPPLLFVPHGT